MSEKECVEIALAADQGYFCGLFVTACSIAAHADKAVALRFHILDAGVREEDKRFVEAKTAILHPGCTFEWLPVDQKMFEGLPKWNGGYMVYTRLLLPKLLKDIDWCIYCDCDFTWMRDIAELWRERDDAYVLLSTKDGTDYTLNIEEAWFKKHGYPIDRERYFCAGLTFFNLKRFRNEGIDRKCMEILQSHPPYNDQSVMNITGYGRVKLVPQVWQLFTEVVTQAELDGGVVIHHAGEVPWKPMKGIAYLSDTRLIWHRMNARYRGITTWRSLRMWFSPGRIIWHRLLAVMPRCPGVGVLIKFGLRLVGHSGVVKFMTIRSRRLKFGRKVVLK